MSLKINFIIYIVILTLLILTKIILYILKTNLKFKLPNYVFFGLNNYQINFIIISSFIYIFLFYFLKSYITNTNIDYIVITGVFYMIWYILTKLIVNNISTMSDSI